MPNRWKPKKVPQLEKTKTPQKTFMDLAQDWLGTLEAWQQHERLLAESIQICKAQIESMRPWVTQMDALAKINTQPTSNTTLSVTTDILEPKLRKYLQEWESLKKHWESQGEDSKVIAMSVAINDLNKLLDRKNHI